jgi:hypothetical protein
VRQLQLATTQRCSTHTYTHTHNCVHAAGSRGHDECRTHAPDAGARHDGPFARLHSAGAVAAHGRQVPRGHWEREGDGVTRGQVYAVEAHEQF